MELIGEKRRFARWFERAFATDQLRSIIQGFSSTFDLFVSFADASGSYLGGSQFESSLCVSFRKDIPSSVLCNDSVRDGILRSSRNGKPLVFRCRCGGVNLAVPIMVGDTVEGCIVSGKFLLRRYSEDELQYFLQGRYPEREDCPSLASSFAGILVVDGVFVERTRERLCLMAAHVGKMYQRDVLEAQNIMKGPARRIDDVTFENSLKILQARDLRSQLNPHFLFNTLNTMSQLAMLEGAEKTQELTYQFSEYLRYVMRKQSRQEVVPLGMEIGCIQRYLEIFRIRFRDRLEYDISVAQGAEKAEIPFMLLQPLVENAILHGIEPSLDPGFVRIGAVTVGSFVLIDIADNGVGCDIEKVSGGIGLQNVRERMVLHFGDSSDLQIKSVPGEGTQVSIRIPFEGA